MKKKHFNRINYNRVFYRVICVFLAVLLLAGIPTAAAAGELDAGLSGRTTASLQTTGASLIRPEEGSYQIYTLHWNTVVNAQYARGVGADIVTDTPSGERNEVWLLKYSSGAYFTLSPLHAGNCYLTSRGYDRGLTLSGIKTNDSLWQALRNSDGSVILRNRNGYVMDTTCGRIDQVGTIVLSYQSNGFAEAQHYWLSRVSESSTLTPSTRVNAFNKSSCALMYGGSKCVNIQYARTAGGLAVIDTYNGESNELFRITARRNNLVSIHPLHATSYCLSVGNAIPGNQVKLEKYADSDQNLWEIYRFSNGTYGFRNYKTKLFLDDYCCNTTDGTKIITHSYNGCSAQQIALKDAAVSGSSSGSSGSSSAASSAQSQITQRLNAMISGAYGGNTYKSGTRYTGAYSSEQCKGFAKKVHMVLFGYNIGSTKAKPYNYQISINSRNTKLVGSLTSLSQKSDSSVRSLFASARPGDFIQLRRSHGGSHSMIFLSSNSSGVTVYECNVDGRNGIRTATYSWKQFRSSNAAVSVYTANAYYLH